MVWWSLQGRSPSVKTPGLEFGGTKPGQGTSLEPRLAFRPEHVLRAGEVMQLVYRPVVSHGIQIGFRAQSLLAATRFFHSHQRA